MNIHVTEDQYKLLKKQVLVSIKMGSFLYGTNIKTSDTDFLHIIAQSRSQDSSLVWTHHNFQYKEEGVDHVFTTLQNFIRNILKGDSTVNYECLYSKELESSSLNWLCSFRQEIKGYALLRSYLGIARRDLKQFFQKKDSKKLFHALRGVWSYEMILDGSYSNDLESVNKSFYSFLMKIRKGEINQNDMEQIAKDLMEKIESLRKNVSLLMNEGKILRIMEEGKLRALDQSLINYCQTKDYLDKKQDSGILDSVYKYLDSDIVYGEKVGE